MKKFTADDVDNHSDHEPDATYYDSREADARMEVFKRAIDSCLLVLALDLVERNKFQKAAMAAIEEGKKAQSL
jgi:hypothetical protein